MFHLPNLGSHRPRVLPCSKSSCSRRRAGSYPKFRACHKPGCGASPGAPPRAKVGKVPNVPASGCGGVGGSLPTGGEKADPRGRPARGARLPPTARARPARPRPSDPPGGLCAGLCRADKFSAAAFSRTVAMTAAGQTPQSTPPPLLPLRKLRARAGAPG